MLARDILQIEFKGDKRKKQHRGDNVKLDFVVGDTLNSVDRKVCLSEWFGGLICVLGRFDSDISDQL